MDFIIVALANFIDKVADVLPSFTFVHNIADDINFLMPYLRKANILMPIDTLLEVFAIFISLQLILISYYFITRAINLIRGAG